MLLIRGLLEKRRDLFVGILVGVAAASLPYGFLVGLLAGTALCYLWKPATLAD